MTTWFPVHGIWQFRACSAKADGDLGVMPSSLLEFLRLRPSIRTAAVYAKPAVGRHDKIR